MLDRHAHYPIVPRPACEPCACGASGVEMGGCGRCYPLLGSAGPWCHADGSEHGQQRREPRRVLWHDDDHRLIAGQHRQVREFRNLETLGSGDHRQFWRAGDDQHSPRPFVAAGPYGFSLSRWPPSRWISRRHTILRSAHRSARHTHSRGGDSRCSWHTPAGNVTSDFFRSAGISSTAADGPRIASATQAAAQSRQQDADGSTNVRCVELRAYRSNRPCHQQTGGNEAEYRDACYAGPAQRQVALAGRTFAAASNFRFAQLVAVCARRMRG